VDEKREGIFEEQTVLLTVLFLSCANNKKGDIKKRTSKTLGIEEDTVHFFKIIC